MFKNEWKTKNRLHFSVQKVCKAVIGIQYFEGRDKGSSGSWIFQN